MLEALQIISPSIDHHSTMNSLTYSFFQHQLTIFSIFFSSAWREEIGKEENKLIGLSDGEEALNIGGVWEKKIRQGEKFMHRKIIFDILIILNVVRNLNFSRMNSRDRNKFFKKKSFLVKVRLGNMNKLRDALGRGWKSGIFYIGR